MALADTPARTPSQPSARPPRFDPLPPTKGATASLTVRIEGEALGRARIEFLAGPNRGVVLGTEADGTLERAGLYPGFSLVRVTAPGAASCTRELTLRHRKTVAFELALGSSGLVRGSVVSEEGAPVANAQVEIDGHAVSSIADGGFVGQRRASGPAFVVARQEGGTPFCTNVPERGSSETTIELRAGCGLSIELDGGSGAAVLYVLPGPAQRVHGSPPRPAFPWHELNPVHAGPGGSVVLSDLPRGPVFLHAFRRGARAGPVKVWLRPGETTRATLEMETFDLLAGSVLDDAEPVSGATVALVADDPLRATLRAFGGGSPPYLTQPIEFLPPARLEVRTDEAGRFELPWWPVEGRTRYLIVTAPGGGTRIVRRIEDEHEVMFDLASP